MRYGYPGSGLGFLVASDGVLTPKYTTRDVTSWGRMLDTSPVFRTLQWLDLVTNTRDALIADRSQSWTHHRQRARFQRENLDPPALGMLDTPSETFHRLRARLDRLRGFR